MPPPVPRGNLVSPLGVDPAGNLYLLSLDAAGNLLVSLGAAGAVSHVIVDSGTLNALAQGKDAGGVTRVLLVDAAGAPIMCGADSGGAPRHLQTDTSGRLIVDGQTPSIFRPVPIGVAYSNLNLPVGTSDQTIWTVPANQFWEVTSVSIRYGGTVAGVSLQVRFTVGGVTAIYSNVLTVVSDVIYSYNTAIVVGNGDLVIGRIVGATVGDDFYGWLTAKRVY